MNRTIVFCVGLLAMVFGVGSACDSLFDKEPIKQIIGETTVLQTHLIERPVYDGSAGKTEILIFSLDGRKKLKRIVREGDWHCLGYIKKNNVFLFAGEFQVGALSALTEMKYLSEKSFLEKDSKYRLGVPKGSGWTSYTSASSEGLKYVAFVGQLYDDQWGLMVLNTETDVMKHLGTPPAPPPVTDPHWLKEVQRMMAEDHEWAWGGPGADEYIPMDKNIVVFKNDKMIVSYGHDTPVKRAEKRIYRTWDLKKVFK